MGAHSCASMIFFQILSELYFDVMKKEEQQGSSLAHNHATDPLLGESRDYILCDDASTTSTLIEPPVQAMNEQI